ncbi:MAG: hypothetical protein LUC26_01900 [Prevotella sp.]|nr:hypothetical protein [Prevotella sp.]
MKKYIKPNIEVVAGGSMQTFAGGLNDSVNPNDQLGKGTDNWEPEQDVDSDW